ncbi:WD repeat-containing protein 75 [Termitomyces sp. J132]|nr:WD repeat-containing protein 75 [Termitomyces sp. J132]
MAASTSRQPHEIPLPPSPTNAVKFTKKQNSRKGKGKENFSAPLEATTSWDDLVPEPDWEWSYLTDPSASKVPPIFTKDGKYFFSLVGSSVKIHSVTTGQVVSTLIAPRSTSNATSSDLLTTAIINPHNNFQLITGSLDGRLVIWDYVEAILLQMIDISQPIHYICAHESWRDTVFVAASRPSKKTKTYGNDDNAVVLRVLLRARDSTSMSKEILPIGKTRFPTGLTLSPSGSWLVATAGHKAYVAATSSLTTGFIKYVSPERLTCLAFHPTEEYFATGDDKGNIRLWYCLNEVQPVTSRGVEKKAQTTTLHWHAHAVSSIAFTSNGSYLLSGGEESVLVIWQIHSGKKEFVPRVGAPIITVSVSKNDKEEEFLLGLADATYVFVSSGNLKISRGYSRIKLDPSMPHQTTFERTHVPLAVHSLSSTLILPSSHPSSLQVYSPSSSKLVSELEVSPSNRVSRRDEKPVEPSFVEHTSLSSSGDWLATIDARYVDDGFQNEIYLKLWRWDVKNGRWTLNTRIDHPHGPHRVTCISFSSGLKPSLATSGEDGAVKIWGLKLTKAKSETVDEFWVARSTSGFRSEVPHSAAWSQDASLLAITFGPYVALYDSMTNDLYQTLVSPKGNTNRSAHFLGKEGRYLVVAGEHSVTLWDLITQTVRWSYKALLSIIQVVPHPVTDSFAVFYTSPGQERQKTRILIFRSASPTPFIARSLPFRIRTVAPYLLARSSDHIFVGITRDWDVALLGDSSKQTQKEGSIATGIISSSIPQKRTLFQDIFGKAAFAEIPSTTISTSETQYTNHGKTMNPNAFAAPAYLMPAFDHIFDQIIGGFLQPRSDDLRTGLPPDDEDVDMEEESAAIAFDGVSSVRVVSQEEMSLLVTLFRDQSIECALPSDGYPPKLKSSHARQTTKVASSPTIGAKQNSPHRRYLAASSEIDITASSSVEFLSGRKRKKSLS